MTRVGPYTLEEPLAERAEVYRACAPDGAEVLIRLLGRGGDVSEGALARFHREVRAAAAIEHPHLARVLDHGVDPERGPWLAMPRGQSMTLRDLFAGRRLCPEAALVIARPVVEALAALHERGLVHREVRPENVEVTPLGDVTLVGLGLALTEHDPSAADPDVAASPYRSPERATGLDVDATADVWAVGVVLFELITGERPSGPEQVPDGRPAPPPSLGEVDRRVGPELDWLVGVCLAADPWARPKDARALLERMAPLAPPAADDMRRERVSILSDPAAYQRRVGARVLASVHASAKAALRAGDPAEARRLLERARAYAPDDAATQTLAEAARAGVLLEDAPPEAEEPAPSRASASSKRPPIGRRWWPAIGLGLLAAGGAVLLGVGRPASPRRAESPRARQAELAADDVLGADVPEAEARAADAGPGALAFVALRLDRLPNDGPSELAGLVRAEGGPLVEASARDEDPALALARAEASNARDPADVSAPRERALALLALGREREGLRALGGLDPEAPGVRLALGWVRVRQGRFEEADRLLGAALREAPDDPVARRRRGILRHRSGRVRDGYRDLEVALRADPDDLPALTEMARLYVGVGRARDAEPLVRRALYVDPENVEATFLLGLVLGESSEPSEIDEAIAAAGRAVQLAPDDPRALRQDCTLRARHARPGAVAACTEAILRTPRAAELFMARATELSRTDQHRPALADADRALELDPGSARRRRERAELRRRAGDDEGADRDLQAACELGDADSCMRLRRGGPAP